MSPQEADALAQSLLEEFDSFLEHIGQFAERFRAVGALGHLLTAERREEIETATQELLDEIAKLEAQA